MITTVLFDFGGVFTPSPFAAVKAGGVVNGHDPEVLLALVFGPYDRDTDHPWHQLERGAQCAAGGINGILHCGALFMMVFMRSRRSDAGGCE